MVKIRLLRAGAKKRPFYRIVAMDERRKRDGRALEFLGTYDPGPEPEIGRQGRVAKAMRAVLAASRCAPDARLEIVE